nr:4234_t:CDS:2 [Entrophospora candida]
MLADLVKKPQRVEPKSILYLRRTTIVVAILALTLFFVVLVMKLDDEQPTITTSYLKSAIDDHDSLPAPVNPGDCQQFVTQPKLSPHGTYGRSYVGKFAPKDLNLFREDEQGKPFLFILVVQVDPLHYGPNYTVAMNVFDSEFDPWSDDFDQSKMTPFVESFDSMNYYVTPSGVGYLLEYSRRIRKTLPDSKTNLIGFRTPKYNEVKYIESEIQTINRNLVGEFANFKVIVQDFSVAVEQEQRINSLVTVLGTVAGYYGIIVTFYIFLFGTNSISPWGFAHNGCFVFKRLKRKTEAKLNEGNELENEDNRISIITVDTNGQEDPLNEQINYSKRLRDLEKFRKQLESNFIDTSLMNSIKKEQQ